MVLDKIFAIKIKRSDNTYSDPIPLKTLAQNIQWDSTHDISIKEILGNVNLTKTIQGQLNDLQNNKISANSLSTYVGNQLQADVNEWLAQNVNPNEVLKQTDLHGDGTIKTQYSSAEIEETSGRQYAVVKDNSDKLSVIVPWTDTDTPADMQYIWSGICTTPANESNKSIILDKMDNFEINGDLTTINHGVTIAVYFTTGNTAQSPKLTIQGSGVGALPIYYAVDNETTLEMDVDTPEPWYTFTPGLKFFTCRKIDNKTVWLLTTVDYSLISHLSRTIATQDSPEFSGTPTAPTAATNTNNNQIATTGFVHNAIDGVLDEYLKTTTEMPVNSQNPPEQPSQDRQYPVVKDSEGNLSVNVPWSSSDADAAVQKIWTGTCNTLAATAIKSVVLDHPAGFSVTNGTTIIVYFTNGNSANTPMLNVNDDIRNILYQSDANTIAAMQANTSTAISNWGAGLKIFTYYTQGSIGWVMQSPDMTNIRYLLNYKADLNSPAFTGSPTAPTPTTGDSSTKLATTAFVNNAIENNSTAQQSISEDFNTQLNYEVGDYVYYNNKLYRFVKSHAAGEWVASQVELVSITNDLQNTKQTLNSVLVDNGITLQNNNKAKLSSISSTAGFTRITNNTNLVEFNYPYSRNVDNPTVSLPLSLGTGKWLVGFKIKIVPNPVVTSPSNYGISWVNGPTLDMGSLGSWINVSKYLTNLDAITLRLIQYPNVNYNPNGNSTITLSIKDLYIYNLDVDIADNTDFKNYIINEQNRNYQSGTVTYSSPNYGTDKTLTQYGKAADAKIVGDVFNDVLVKNENEYTEYQKTFTNFLSLDNEHWATISPNSTNLVQRNSNYIKFEITRTGQYSSNLYVMTKIPEIQYRVNGFYLIGFKYKFNTTNSSKFTRLYFTSDNSLNNKLITTKAFDDWENCFYIFSRTNSSFANMRVIARYDNLDADDLTATFEIKDFYFYFIPGNLSTNDPLINYICRKQIQNYQDGTVIYENKYIPDTSLSISGKAADAAAVREFLNDTFILDQNENEIFTPLASLDNFAAEEDAQLVQSSNNYKKYYFSRTYTSSGAATTSSFCKIQLPQTLSGNNKVLIGFDYKTQSAGDIPFTEIGLMFATEEDNATGDTIVLYPSQNWETFYTSLEFIKDMASISNLKYIYIYFTYNIDSAPVTADNIFEIRNFYIYKISSNTSDEDINKIISLQSNNETYSNSIINLNTRTDRTLTEYGKAADAAAVGNAIAAIIKPPNFSKWKWAQAFSTAFNEDITFSKSGWWCLHLQKKDGTNAAIRAEISIYIESAERYREILEYQSAKTTENLEYMSQWYYFSKGQTIHFSGSAAVCNLYYCPCL